RAARTIPLSCLSVGGQGSIEQTHNADGTYTVTGLAVVVPSVRGTVGDVTSSSFKVTTRDGSFCAIAVDVSTQVLFGNVAGTMADVTAEAIVGVQGATTGDNAMTA